MPKKKKSKKGPNLIGLRKNAYKAHTRDFVDSLDQDWVKKLPPKEKKWYNKFLREYYGTTFSSSKSLHKGGKAKRRELYREKNHREGDVTYKCNRAIVFSDANYDNNDYAYESENALIDLIDLKNKVVQTAEDMGDDLDKLSDQELAELINKQRKDE